MITNIDFKTGHPEELVPEESPEVKQSEMQEKISTCALKKLEQAPNDNRRDFMHPIEVTGKVIWLGAVLTAFSVYAGGQGVIMTGKRVANLLGVRDLTEREKCLSWKNHALLFVPFINMEAMINWGSAAGDQE